MKKLRAGLTAAALIWGGTQITIGELLRGNIHDLRQTLAQVTGNVTGAIGPLQVSSDICTMLTAGNSLKRGLSRVAFPFANSSADKLRQSYRFEAVNPCQRGAGNAVLAYKQGDKS